MKLNGNVFDGPNEEILVLPRNGKDLVFKARAVLDYDEFDALCPRPNPPKAVLPGGEEKALVNDPGFLQQLDQWSTKRTHYLVLKSLQATPGLEWDTIKMDDPQTWGGYREELKKAFFSDREVIMIINTVWAANGIDDDKLEQARKRFLAGQEAVASQEQI